MKKATGKNLMKLGMLVLVLLVGGYMIFTWLQVRGG